VLDPYQTALLGLAAELLKVLVQVTVLLTARALLHTPLLYGR